MPFGGHKGYGLGLMAELLGGVLSGAGAAALPGFAGANGTLMLAIDISRFLPLATFTHQAVYFLATALMGALALGVRL